MKQNLKTSGDKSNGIFDRFAAEKKKSIIAVCLITIMVFMWVKVLGRKGPQSADAAVTALKTADEKESPKLKVSYMELPKVEGRNDVLTRDFFAVGSWRDFIRGEGVGKLIDDRRERMDDKRNGSEEIVRRIAGSLKLDAIVLGENPQTFINDKLLSVGDKLFIRDGANTYECEVTKIEENAVSIKCGEAEVTLRLAQTSINN
jgi:hypothetical protein